MSIEGIVAIITALSVAVGSVIALARFHADQNKNREDRKAGDIDLLAKMDKREISVGNLVFLTLNFFYISSQIIGGFHETTTS